MTTLPADPLVGATLGPFRITKVLGQGGMGTVYLGEHSVIGSRVAIKVLLDKLASDESLVARFYAEARAVNLIGHENIVNIFDMNVVPPHRYYLVMEYLEGQPLNYLLAAPVLPLLAVRILVQVCDALGAAHQAGVVHRDLKPENIFLIKQGRTEHFVKVLDFGLAKLLDTERSSSRTAVGLIVGTPEFMSPEQANSAPVDGRSDLYSLGCIAWLMLTARLPFAERGLTDLLIAHRGHMPQPPHVVNPAVPKALSDVVMRAMAKSPADRFQTAAQFAHALETALAASSEKSTKPPAVPEPPAQRHTARFDAAVMRLDGVLLGRHICTDISKGGMFLSSAGELPPLFSRVKIIVPEAGDLSLLAEVVRHVPEEQAKAWGMQPGFGVQFLDVTPSLREDIGRLMQGLPVQPRTDRNPHEGKTVEAVLAWYRDRVHGDHYATLGLEPTAELQEIRNRCIEAERQLLDLKPKTLIPSELGQLDAALSRLKIAKDTLSKPIPKARYDANRGNWKGVARCMLTGLGPLELERLRQAFLADRAGAAGSAHVKFLASRGYEQNNQFKEALEACESALQIDPLNLSLHQRRLVLERKLQSLLHP